MVRSPATPSRRRSAAAAALLLALCLAGLALAPAARAGGRPTYVNPVSRGFADTFADPSVIRAGDGFWYAYGTTDPLREGERTRHLIPTARSRDLVHWTHVGDAFTESTLPAWAAPDAALWAPDIRHRHGTYYLYYVVTQTTVTDEPDDNAIGVATAPSPTGPWTDSGGPVVGPRRGDSGKPGDFKWTFDPAQLTDRDGTRYLYYGSYYGGIFVTELTADGTRAVGEPTMLLDRLDWVGGWPTVRGGRWASQGPQPAPVTSPAGHPAPAPRPLPPPRVGRVVFTDRFDGGTLGPGWSWVRGPDPAAQVTGGALRWPTQPGDLVGPDETASVLLRRAPAGRYTLETRLAIDLGTDDVRNYQQAGLVAYLDDDHFLRLSHVAIWNTRQTEFVKEMPFAGATSYGGMAVGTPAPVTRLRLRHRLDRANGEHEFQAATSRDGRHWTWGGVWTLPAGTRPRIGLISHGGAGAVAEFDYVRIYQP